MFTENSLKILFWSTLPISILIVTALVLMVLGFFVRKSSKTLLILSLIGIAFSFYESINLWSWKLFASASMVTVDPFAAYLYLIILSIGFLTCLVHSGYLSKQEVEYTEVYPLTLFAMVGMMMMVSTTHLLLFFIALEVMSLAVYILVGIKRTDLRSNEAAMKYFILGALAAGFFLYGVALVFGATGSLDLKVIGASVIDIKDILYFKIGVLLILFTFAFKIGAVPFHFWTPDVYEGAPISVTGFMATAVKTAAFGAFIRALFPLLKVASFPIEQILQFLCIATIIVGNLVALYQTNLKRMLAYSSIAHAGYILVGVSVIYDQGIFHPQFLGAPLFYLLSYGIMTLGAFAVAAALAGNTDDQVKMHHYLGLAKRSPKLAAAMAVFMIGLTGIPPTVGFTGKFFLFREAVHQGFYGLIIVGVLMSAISAYYYLSVVVAMYFGKSNQGENSFVPTQTALGLKLVILFCLISTFYLGFNPSQFLKIASTSSFVSAKNALIP